MQAEPQQSELLVTRDGGLLEVVFNRPAKKNAFTEQMYHRFTAVLQEAATDHNVRVILLRGAGDAFTSGNDLNTFLDIINGDHQSPAVFDFLEALVANEVPMVAAVHGVCTGLGAALLLHCDTVIAAPDTRFGFSFTNIGATPEVCASMLLPQLCGYQKAAHLILTGRFFDGEEALQLGLVTELAAQQAVVGRARDIVEMLLPKASAALRLSKRLLKRAPETYVQRLAVEEAVFAERLQSPEMEQAIHNILNRKVAK